MAATDVMTRVDSLPESQLVALLALADSDALADILTKSTELLALADKSEELLALLETGQGTTAEV